MRAFFNRLQDRLAGTFVGRNAALRTIFVGGSLLVLALALLWIIDKFFILSMSRGYVEQIALVFNLNRHLAEAISLAVFVLLFYFATKLFSFSQSNRRIGYAGVITLLIANSIALWQGSKGQFFEASGAATKCYVLNRDGVRYGERPGIDPLTGKMCKPVTPELIERLQTYAQGKRPERIVSKEPSFFDPRSGEPIVWYAKSDSDIELFDLMGFHPETGVELTAVTPDVVEAWKLQQRTIAERAPQRVDPEKFVFFDPRSGVAKAWYWRSAEGDFEFYDNKGFQPNTGEPLVPVSREIIADWKTQSAKKCYVVTRESIRFLSKPGIDPQTGRECRPFTTSLLERLREYEKGNRPKRISGPEPVFFDLRTGEPNLWYGQDKAGQIQLFDLIGFHPDTGQELLPVTPDIANAWKAQQATANQKPPQRIDPDRYSLFDPVTGQPRVWYWRGVDGSWEFYDNPGFRNTGEKLQQISHDTIDAWKKETADRARRARDDAARAEQQRIEAAARAQQQQTDEAMRVAQEQQSGSLCDQAAANPTDARKPISVSGVEYLDLKANAKYAVDICTTAVRLFPSEIRYRYNLGRALEFVDTDRALSLYRDLAKQGYPAVYDNLGGVLYNTQKNLPAAIHQYEIGVRLNDPSAMVSLAFLIKKNLYPSSNPDAARMALLTKASQAGHHGAQLMLEKEQAAMQQQLQYQQTQQEQQRMMLNLFGTVLRGVAR